MTLHTKQGGTWREITSGDFQVKVAGTWQAIQTGYVKVAGTWQEFFINSLLNPAVDGSTYNITSTGTGVQTAEAGLLIYTNDDLEEYLRVSGSPTTNVFENWYLAGATGSDYEVQVTVTGDTLDVDSDSTSTWLALSSTREWYLTAPGSSGLSKSSALTVTIRHATNTSDSISFTVNLSATNS